MNNVTTVIAWWGAIISTAVLAWDVYKWRKTGRPKLVVKASGNLQDLDSNNPQKYVSISVTNVGDKPTTLCLITMRYYKTKPSRSREPDARGVFLEPLRPTPSALPFKLDVGVEWRCLVFQTGELEKLTKEGYYYIEAEDTSQSDPWKFARSRLLLD